MNDYRLNLRVPAAIGERFAALAEADGGRSRVLRQMVEAYLAAEGEGALAEKAGLATRGRDVKLTVRLRAEELSRLEEVSREAGFLRTSWITALVRSRLLKRPALNPADAEAYRRATQELNRIGRNLNQIARAMNTAVLEGSVLKAEAHIIENARNEIRAISRDLHDALSGNRRYWEGRE